MKINKEKNKNRNIFVIRYKVDGSEYFLGAYRARPPRGRKKNIKKK